MDNNKIITHAHVDFICHMMCVHSSLKKGNLRLLTEDFSLQLFQKYFVHFKKANLASLLQSWIKYVSKMHKTQFRYPLYRFSLSLLGLTYGMVPNIDPHHQEKLDFITPPTPECTYPLPIYACSYFSLAI